MSEDIRVLIVDDSAFMRNLIGRIVESTDGLNVAGKAMNGVFALNKIKTLQPDVLVLDLEMPEMNGIEFLKERKRLGIEIPVVILSSLARKGARITMEALALGASDFVLKPSDANDTEMAKVAGQLTQQLKAYGGRHRKQSSRGKRTPTGIQDPRSIFTGAGSRGPAYACRVYPGVRRQSQSDLPFVGKRGGGR